MFSSDVFHAAFPIYPVWDPEQLRLRSLYRYLQHQYVDFSRDIQIAAPKALLAAYQKMYRAIRELFAHNSRASEYLERAKQKYIGDFERRIKAVVGDGSKYSEMYLKYVAQTDTILWAIHERALEQYRRDPKQPMDRYQRQFNRTYNQRRIEANAIKAQKVAVLGREIQALALSIRSDVKHILEIV